MKLMVPDFCFSVKQIENFPTVRVERERERVRVSIPNFKKAC